MKYLDEEMQPAPYYEDRHKYIGEINIADGIVDVTDPCYEDDTWCARFGMKIKPGIYKCYVDVINFPAKALCEEGDYFLFAEGFRPDDIIEQDDHRIMNLTIVHQDSDYPDEFELIDENIGVDAGLCGFYNHKPSFKEDREWDSFWQSLDKYKHCSCDCGTGNGVTVSSGFGDGVYCLFGAKNTNDEIIALKLDFNDDAPDEDSYADEYEY